MISIAIPVCITSAAQEEKLFQLLESIAKQDYKDYEVVISDNNPVYWDNERINQQLARFDFKIFYDWNPILGVSANTNNAIEKCAYDKVKIMYHDDLFLTSDALGLFSAALSRYGWVISDSYYIGANGLQMGLNSAYYSPYWCGSNTVGMPSVVGFSKNGGFSFDTTLKTLLDVDFYNQLYGAYGLPYHIRKPIIGQRIWGESVSAKQPDFAAEEIERMKKGA